MKETSTIAVLAQPASSLALPIQLAQQAASAVRELLAEAAAANTTRSYASALRYWAGWHAARHGVEFTLPIPEATVLHFVVNHVVRRWADGGRGTANRCYRDLDTGQTDLESSRGIAGG
jgi:hypothetical protein